MFNYNDIRNNKVLSGQSDSEMSDMSGFPQGFNGVLTLNQLRDRTVTGNIQQFNREVPSESDSFFSGFGSATPSGVPHSVPLTHNQQQLTHMPYYCADAQVAVVQEASLEEEKDDYLVVNCQVAQSTYPPQSSQAVPNFPRFNMTPVRAIRTANLTNKGPGYPTG